MATGAMVATGGVGASIILIPGLMGMGLTQLSANATSMAVLSGSAMMTAGTLAMHGNCDFVSAACIALPGMVTARIAAQNAKRIPELYLRLGFSALIISVAPVILYKMWNESAETHDSEHSSVNSASTSIVTVESDNITTATESKTQYMPLSTYVGHMGVGVGTGFLSGVIGVGGTPLVMVYLAAVCGLPQTTVLGTAAAAMIPTAVVSSITHLQQGNIAVKILPALAVGSIIGSFAGAKIALAVPDEYLKAFFAAIMVAVSAQTAVKTVPLMRQLMKGVPKT